MALTETYKVDFTGYRKDLVEQALGRMLSQHYGKPILRQFVAVIMREAQALYDALIDLQEQRSLYMAQGENLDALGRIVGESRGLWNYDETGYVAFDRYDQPPDLLPAWCKYAPLGVTREVDDTEYRLNILAKAIKNHTLTSSPNELAHIIKVLLGVGVSFQKAGPNQVNLIIHVAISSTALRILTTSITNSLMDESYAVPYPVTLNFDKIIHYHKIFLFFDREDLTADDTPVGVGVF